MSPKADLTTGPITATMLRFALPMILGNLLQQFYNVADTFIVGQFLGAGALAAVPAIGVVGIWWSVPIGWMLADAVGLLYYKKIQGGLLKGGPAPGKEAG